jgi:hypothetical protein
MFICLRRAVFLRYLATYFPFPLRCSKTNVSNRPANQATGQPANQQTDHRTNPTSKGRTTAASLSQPDAETSETSTINSQLISEKLDETNNDGQWTCKSLSWAGKYDL